MKKDEKNMVCHVLMNTFFEKLGKPIKNDKDKIIYVFIRKKKQNVKEKNCDNNKGDTLC